MHWDFSISLTVLPITVLEIAVLAIVITAFREICPAKLTQDYKQNREHISIFSWPLEMFLK